MEVAMEAPDQAALEHTCTWTLENWSQETRTEIPSDTFLIEGCKWSMTLSIIGGLLSLYLNVPDSAGLWSGWGRFASFTLTVVNQIYPEWTVTSGRQIHQFNQGFPSYGYCTLMSVVTLRDPSQGFIVNNSLKVRVKMGMRMAPGYVQSNPFQATVGNIGVQAHTTGEIPLDEDPTNELAVVQATKTDLVTLNKSAKYFTQPRGRRRRSKNFNQQDPQQAVRARVKEKGKDQQQAIIPAIETDDVQARTFTWKLENWSQQPRPQIISETFEIGGYKCKWRMSLRLTEPSPGHDAGAIALSLRVPDPEELASGWSRFASFTLAVVNQVDPEQTVKSAPQKHNFNEFSPIFGFVDMMSRAILRNPSRGFIANDSLVIQIDLELDLWNVPDYSQTPFPATEVNVGVQVHTTVEVPLDEDTTNKLAVVKATELDVETLNQHDHQQVADVPRIASPTKNQPADDVHSRTFTWTLENWSQETRHKIKSETFVIGGYEWRMSLRLTESLPGVDHGYLALLLRVLDSAELPLGWSKRACLTWAVVNQFDPERTVKSAPQMHHFKKESKTFVNFMLLSTLFPQSNGFIVNDSLIIQVEMDILDVPIYLPATLPATVVNAGIQVFNLVEVPLDADRVDELAAVRATETDIETLNQQDLQQVANMLQKDSATESQLADDVQSRTFTWKLEDWSQGSLYEIISDTFEIQGYKWRVRLSLNPRGKDPYLSLHLEVPNSETLSRGWSRSASFSFRVVNKSDPTKSLKRDQKHHFNQDSRRSGFPKFLSLRNLGDFVVNDFFILQANVDIIGKASENNVPDMELYDSKRVTGFVGLKNQGATCYLNSLIQTLYHLPCFRKAVYEVPISPNKLPSESTCLALQSLFYTMQFGDTSPETVDLTESLGWDTRRLAQEDAHEFNRVLFAKLDEEMKGTSLDGKIQQLFEGHFNSIVKCINVDHESTRKEPFYDLHLTVKGYKDVYESLDTYVEVEKLDGANQYHPGPEQYSLQDAIKQARFTDFPPILQLHLMRFVYDLDSDPPVTRKINDRYKFPLKLDLDRENGKYLDSREADRSVRNFYLLHSVLVHSGASHNAGHYYSFIRPTLSGQWYKFNDSLVTKEELKTVLEGHWGGEEEEQRHMVQANSELTNTASRLSKHSTAYILVYVREIDKEKVMCSVDQKGIPEHLHVALKAGEGRRSKTRLGVSLMR